MEIKYGICEWSLPLTGPNNCKIISEIGFDGMSLDVGTYELDYPLANPRVQENYLIEKERWGIEFPSIVINDLCNYNLCADKESEDRRIAMYSVKKSISAALAMKISTVFLPSFLASDIKNEQDFQATCAFIKEACNYAKDAGIDVCTENKLTAKENIRMLEVIDEINCKVYFDTQNPHSFHGYDAAEMIRELGDRIKEVHVKDGFTGEMSAAMLGQGESDFLSSLKALVDIEYTGWLVNENMYFKRPLSQQAADPFELVTKDLKYLKESINKLVK